MSNSEYDNTMLPMQRAVRWGVIGWAIVSIISLILWFVLRQMPGVWGVILGGGIGGGFVLLTALSVLLTAKSSPSVSVGAVLGGWLLKMILLIIVLLIIRNLEFYDKVAFFVTVVASLVVTLGTEAWGIKSTKVTYVS